MGSSRIAFICRGSVLTMALKQATTGLILLVLVSASLSDVTQEEIDRKGAEIMEEYRRDSGHWIHLGDKETIDHMTDNIGANGIAVGGFFISQGKYSSLMPGEEEQNADPLFVAFKELGTNQGWLADLGMGHKTWTFGYAHDKALATEAGCEDLGENLFDHVCIIIWKTSPNGGH